MAALSNAKHEAVAQAYIADRERIGWRAYQSVYPRSSQRAAVTSWSALLDNPDFSARLAELAEAAAQGAVMTANEVLAELTKIARANMADYMRVGPGGDPVLDFGQLTRDQAAALQEVTVEDFLDARAGAGEVLEDQAHGGALKRSHGREVRRVKFKLASKIDALGLLGKHHRLYIDRVEHDVAGGVAARLAAAIARVGETKDPDGDRKEAQERPPRRPPRKRSARKPARKGGKARAR